MQQKKILKSCESLGKALNRASLSISGIPISEKRFRYTLQSIDEEFEQLKESSKGKQEEGKKESEDFLTFTKSRYAPEKTALSVPNVREGIRRNFAANIKRGDILHSEQYKIFHRNIPGDILNLVEFVQILLKQRIFLFLEVLCIITLLMICVVVAHQR